MSIKVVGIDLAKDFFQVCVLNIDGTISPNRKVHRDRLLHTIGQPPDNTLLAIESCALSHYWGRVFLGLGLKVSLITDCLEYLERVVIQLRAVSCNN